MFHIQRSEIYFGRWGSLLIQLCSPFWRLVALTMAEGLELDNPWGPFQSHSMILWFWMLPDKYDMIPQETKISLKIFKPLWFEAVCDTYLSADILKEEIRLHLNTVHYKKTNTQ